MTLSKMEASAIIAVVCADKACVARIAHSSSQMTQLLGLSGQLRNISNIGRDVANAIYQGKLKPFESVDYSQETISQMCVGISEVTTRAIKNSMGKLKFIKAVDDHGNTSNEGHYAPMVTMKDGSQYTFDWWMTLNQFNPVIWQTRTWERWPDPAVLYEGRQFYYFREFK